MRTFTLHEFSQDPFPFALVESNPGNWSCQPHVHDYTELVIIRQGSGIHIVDGAEQHLRAGDVFVVQGELAHTYRNVAQLAHTNILFRFDALSLPMEELNLLPGFHTLFRTAPRLRERGEFEHSLHLDEDALSAANLFLGKLRLELKSRTPGYRAAVSGIFTELLVFLCRHFSVSRENMESQLVLRLGRIISRMEECYAEEMTLDGLAAAANLSTRSLLRYFRNAFGMSPIQYLLNIRIAKARELLRYSDRPVNEIARMAGFDDQNYFSRQFRKMTAATPREFRCRHRGKEGMRPSREGMGE